MKTDVTEEPGSTEKYLDHLAQQESRKIVRAPDYTDKVIHRIRTRGENKGPKLPWKKTHGLVGIREGEVSLWAGVNGHGKSAVAGQVFMELARQGEPGCIFSLEMPVASTIERMARQASGVAIPSDDYVIAFSGWLRDRILFYDHLGREAQDKLLAMMRYVRKTHGTKQFLIDSLMGVVRGADNYNAQKDFITDLCSFAKDTGCHVHLVHHSRKGESEMDRIDKFDVKGAGEIVDQVDNLYLVWRNKRKEMAMAQTPPDPKLFAEPDAVVEVGKQRHGDWEGDIKLWYGSDSKAFYETDGRSGWAMAPTEIGVKEDAGVPF